ncbi:MAG: ATP-dependent zinc metalloprotease FtsH [Planctomycetaceae bacterium]|nr:ATP-dependent zinc metalloprotease FtsH [Planctomycetaceae bacterium]
MSNSTPQKPNGSKSPLPKYNRGPFTWLLIGLVIVTLLWTLTHTQRVETLQFWQFQDAVVKGHIKTAVFDDSNREIKGQFSEKGIREREKGKLEQYLVNYNPELLGENYASKLEQQGVQIDFTRGSQWVQLVVSLLPMILLVGLIYFFFLRNLKAGGGMLMNFGRSKHRVQGKGTRITFDNVAGIEEAKDEVAEIIEFLKNPKKFKKIGGRIPRGVLLVGPPGCGKTLLAKAIAGEADVPFFSIAGSDFVEMFVGVGASRVRDLFKQAKENSPCIIFLDEIDAIGRKRGPGFVSGGHDEREQTLNAILVEMDGFDTDDQVIVIAATNRADILDHALTRPGRFDRQVVVPLPDIKGRMKILQIHARKIKYAPTVDFERLARITPMFSGAELEALINEAAISASMQDKDFVEMADLEEARDKVRWGRAKRSRVIDDNDKRLTAYHEAGHALVQSLIPDADPLHKVSIIPRGPMGGATFALPEKDRLFYSRKYCRAQLQVCFGGRIAEEMFFNDITSGASSDIKQATMIAREMVMEWGMGKELGPINYAPDMTQEAYFGMSGPDYSQRTAEVIDTEIKRLIDEAYTKVTDLIEANRDKLENLAQALLKYETLDAEDVKMILDGEVLDKPTVTDLLKLEQQKKPYNPTDKTDKKEKKDDYDIYAGSEDWDKAEEQEKQRRRNSDETFEDDEDKRR